MNTFTGRKRKDYFIFQMAGLFKCVSVCVGCMCVFKCISTLTEHLLYFVLGLFPPIISMCHHLQQPHSKVLNKWFLE